MQLFQGISDDIAVKNRIRRLISEFFVERDCFTMIRPVTDENDLKNLNQIKMEELRPEFVEQVLQLREKV